MKNLKFLLIYLLVFSFVLLTAGCGPSRLNIAMDSWMGSPVSKLVSSWGAPDSSIKLDDGASVLTWIEIWYWQGYRHECRKSFTVGADGKVNHWSYRDC